MKTNTGIDISLPILYLAKFWFLSYMPKCCQPVRLLDSSECNISRKKWMIKCILGILSFCVCNQACLKEFAKSCTMQAYMVYVPICLHAIVVYVLTCLHASVIYMSACHSAIRHTNVSFWHAKWCANFSNISLKKW